MSPADASFTPGALSIVAARTTDDMATARALLVEYAASLSVDLAYQHFAAELRDLPGAYVPPHGDLLLGRIGDTAVGCVALRRLDDTVCEMKRLYVRANYRRGGIASALVERAIAVARTLDYREMRLDTLPDMTAAHALYVRHGFRETAPYGGPAAPGTRYFALRLPHASLPRS